jgi:hypothetical protein
MGYLVDTNILLRSCQPDNPMYSIVIVAVETLLKKGKMLYVSPQNIVEFWNVCTRPLDKNGLGMTPKDAVAEITRFESFLSLKLDVPDIHQQWITLVTKYAVKGVNVHDA